MFLCVSLAPSPPKSFVLFQMSLLFLDAFLSLHDYNVPFFVPLQILVLMLEHLIACLLLWESGADS